MKDIFSFSPEFKKGLSIALCIMVLFSLGFLTGEFTKANVTITTGTEAAGSAPSETPSEAPSVAPSEAPSAPSEAPSEAPAPSEPTESTVPDAAPSGDANAAGKSAAEILALYNESANKVKTNATKVTKNFEDREVGDLVLPSVLQSLGDKVIREAMGDDTDPVDYATAEDIKANFIVPGQDYVSKLTEADIASATCTDNGTEYEIEITAKSQMNPASGTGVGAGFDVIEASEITSSPYASMLETFDVTYTDCVIKCKIDKATGNMTWASYYTPVDLHIVVSMFGTHEVSVAISFLKDYTIAY